ncbi:MAG: M20 metallopeptidase family protein [Francisellaceae bacterium]
MQDVLNNQWLNEDLAIEELNRIRQHIHQYPELGFEVENTAAYIVAELKKLGLEIKTGIGRTGIIADLSVPHATRRIALRADMDALPIFEQNNCDYKSKINGQAHMCGHDAHCAMVLVAAQFLAKHRDKLDNNIRFIFQPSEEVLPGGAPAMIEDGALDDVDEIYGLHVFPLIEEGKMQVCQPVALSGVDLFEICFHGKGGHASTPMLAIDPIIMASQFVNQVQTIVSRNSDSFDPVVISITAIESGSTFNVIPAQAKLKGCIRYLSAKGQNIAKVRLHKIAKAVALSHDGQVTIDYSRGYPETRNWPKTSKKAIEAATAVFGSDNVIRSSTPWMASEDFSYFAKEIPACYAFLGVKNAQKGFTSMVHEPTFDLAPEAMLNGLNYYLTLCGLVDEE